jgi:hypothetical protein
MLIGAGVRAGGGPHWSIGPNTAGATERVNSAQPGMLRGALTGQEGANKAGRPNGHTHPSSWSLPQKGGGMSAYKSINGAGDITAASLAMGRALSASLDGSGDITAATLALIVSLSSNLSGDGELTATMKGAVQMAANLAASGDLTAAMGALVSMSAALTGAGEVTGALRGLASMSAEILSYGELTPEGIRDAVWNALSSTLTAPGTAGAALLAAGSAGDPWGTPLPGAYAAGSAGAILGALINGLTTAQQAQLLDVWQRLGLDPANPLTTTNTTIAAGGVDQTIAETAGPTITVTRQP